MIAHPYRELMIEAERERAITDEPDAAVLRDRVFEALQAYGDFLEKRGLVWEDGRLKASALVATLNFGDGGSRDITLTDGALDRVYANGSNPDPFDAGPADIPHKSRP